MKIKGEVPVPVAVPVPVSATRKEPGSILTTLFVHDNVVVKAFTVGEVAGTGFDPQSVICLTLSYPGRIDFGHFMTQR